MDRRILVVDDDPSVHLMMRILFSRISKETQVTFVSDGSKAVEHISKETPSVVFLDQMMPGMTGREVVDKLQENSSTRNIPVFLMSALFVDIDEIEVPGVRQVLPKSGLLEYVPKAMAQLS